MHISLHLFRLLCYTILTLFPLVRDLWIRTTFISVASNSIFLYTFLVHGWAVIIYSYFALLMLLVAVACVGMRVGLAAWQEPESWSPNFGHF